MRSSMSRKGNRRNNAPKESFRGRLKTAGAHGRKFATREQAGQAVMDRLAFHNHRRLHSSSGCISPMQCGKRRREAHAKRPRKPWVMNSTKQRQGHSSLDGAQAQHQRHRMLR